MTSESLTRIQVLRRAWPLVFANAAVPLAAAADTLVLGLSGDASDLGGVALGGAIISIFLESSDFLGAPSAFSPSGLSLSASGAFSFFAIAKCFPYLSAGTVSKRG